MQFPATQRRKSYRLCAVHPTKRLFVFWPVGDEEQRGRVRNDRQKRDSIDSLISSIEWASSMT